MILDVSSFYFSIHQAVTSSDAAFFSFACALPGAEAAPSPPEHSTITGGVQSVGGDGDDDGDGGGVIGLATSSDEEAEEGGNMGEEEEEQAREAGGDEQGEEEVAVGGQLEDRDGDDGGWEIQEGGECTYFFSLDGEGYLAVEPAAAAAAGDAAVSSSSATGGDRDQDGASSPTSGNSNSNSNTLLLTGLADGGHELRSVGPSYKTKNGRKKHGSRETHSFVHYFLADTSQSLCSFPLSCLFLT